MEKVDEIAGRKALYRHRRDKTSVSLEDAFWKGLKEIAGGRDVTLSDLVSTIDSDRRHGNLSSAIRLFVLDTIGPRSRATRRPNSTEHRARSWAACAPHSRPCGLTEAPRSGCGVRRSAGRTLEPGLHRAAGGVITNGAAGGLATEARSPGAGAGRGLAAGTVDGTDLISIVGGSSGALSTALSDALSEGATVMPAVCSARCAAAAAS